MQLSVRDVAKRLKVPAKTVYSWIQTDHLPAAQIDGQYRLNSTELFEWAAKHGIKVPIELFEDHSNGKPAGVSLVESLEQGGIFYDIDAPDKTSALKAIVGLIKIPKGVSRDSLLRILLAREALASTGIGEGIAIPHPRNPIVLHVPHPVISLCFLKKPVDYQAIDGRPVDVLFAMITPNVRVHLQLLARLAFVLRDASFRKILLKRAPQEAILGALGQFDLPSAQSAAPQKKLAES